MRRFVFMILLISLLVVGVSATTITIPALDVRVHKEVTITSDACTNGLSEYSLTFSVANATLAEITEVTFPAWASTITTGPLPAPSVVVTATDAGDAIQAGDAATLITLQIHSLAAGTTTLGVVANTFKNDTGGAIAPSISNGTLISRTSARVMASATFTPVSTQAFQDLYDSIGGNTSPVNETDAAINWTQFLGATLEPYTLLMGQLALVIIFAIPFVLMWLMHMDITPAAVAGIIIGGFLLAFLPPEYSLLAGIFVVLGLVAVVYSLLKERM
jgi:hypothetical protein